MKDIELPDFLLNEKPCLVLIEVDRIEEPYIKQVAQAVDATPAHTTNIVKYFKENGYLTWQVSGRKRILSLTEDGEKVADALENLYGVLREVGENRG